MAAIRKFVKEHMIFKVIKVLYNNYNYYKLIINCITKLFMKRTIIDIYSAFQSKPLSYRNMSRCLCLYEIANIKAETIANIHWIILYINNMLFNASV